MGLTDDDLVQVILSQHLAARFEEWLAGQGLALFTIPWQKPDGTLTTERNPDGIQTYGVMTMLCDRCFGRGYDVLTPEERGVDGPYGGRCPKCRGTGRREPGHLPASPDASTAG